MAKICKRVASYIYGNSCVFCLLIAFFLNLTVEILSQQSFLKALLMPVKTPLVVVSNMLIVAFTLSLGGFFKKRDFVFMIVGIVWLGLAVANYMLLFFRVTPLCGSDFLILKAAKNIFGLYVSKKQIIAIAILVAGGTASLILTFVKEKSKKVKFIYNGIFTLILGVIVLTVALTGALKPDFSDLAAAYKKYGFVYSFCSTVFDKGIDEPVNYSEKNFSDVVSILGNEPKTEPEIKPDIIYVQLESFFDVSYLKDVQFDSNPTPNFTELKSTYPGGFLKVPVLGGGTANTEFEVLTGVDCRFFGAGEVPFETVLRKQTCESVAYNLKEYGYSTHAIHNHTGTFYQRDKVYPNLGFDTFTSSEYMNINERNQMGWAKDKILIDCISDALSSTDGSDFIHAVSVQAHGNYPSEDLLGENKVIKTLKAGSEEAVSQYNYYANQLFEMDLFIKNLIDTVAMKNKPAIIVFYGDHLPAFWLEDSHVTNNDVYQTEYVIWNNIGLENTKKDIYAYELSSLVLGNLGMNTGFMNKLRQNYSENSEYISFAEKLSYDMFNENGCDYIKPYKTTSMKMGVNEIEITQALKKDGAFVVTGKGFTENSVIAVNGDLKKTEFSDENTLIIYEDVKLKKEANSVKVVQVTENNEMLSETKAFFNIEYE